MNMLGSIIGTCELDRITLANGLRLVFVGYHKLPLVHIHVMVKRGSAWDPSGKEGLADLTAEMITLGTTTRDSQQIAREMEQIGGRYSASAGQDASYLEVVGISDTFTTLMDITADILLHPSFPDQELRQAKERRIARLIQQRDEAEVIADELICQRLFAGTPYAHPPYGTIPSLSSLAGGDPLAFYSRNYHPGEVVILIIGDLPPEVVKENIEMQFVDWQTAGGGDEPPLEPSSPNGKRVILVDRPDLSQSQIRMGLVGIRRQDPNYIPFKVMNYIFGGGGFACRLMQRLRAEKGYTYGIASRFQAGRVRGPFVISTFTPTATTLPLIEEVIKVMEGFVAEGATTKELTEAKRFLVGSFPLRLETPPQVARELLHLELYDIPFDYLTGYRQMVEGVTLEQVNSLAATYLSPEALNLVVVGRGEELEKDLRNWGELEVVPYSEITNAHPPLSTSTQASTTTGS